MAHDVRKMLVMNTSPPPHAHTLRHGAAALAGALLLTLSCSAQAQGVSVLANDALKVLLGNQVDTLPSDALPIDALPNAAQADMSMATPAEGGARSRYVVQRGETLDKIIRKTVASGMTNGRSAMALVRKAFLALNPQAFPRGTVHVISAGATLHIPTTDDLRAMAGGQALPSAAAYGAHSTSDKRNWVRFP